MRKRTLALSAGICLLLAAGCACIAADFSADLYMGPKKPTKMGKVYSAGKMVRVESTMGGKTRVTIMRLDKKVAWMLDPAAKTYMEMPISKPEMADPRSDTMLSRNATKKSLGTETVNGFICQKTAYVSKRTPRGMATRWFAGKLGWPIKTQMNMPDGKTFTQELRNVKTGKQPMSLFSLPKGYKKMAMPQGMSPGGPGGKRGMPGMRGMMPHGKPGAAPKK